MEKPRIRPLWLLLFLLIPLLIFLPLLLGGHIKTAPDSIAPDTEKLRQILSYGAYLGVPLSFYGFVIAFFAWLKNRVAMRASPWLVPFIVTAALVKISQWLLWPVVVEKMFVVAAGFYQADVDQKQLVLDIVGTCTFYGPLTILIALIFSDLLFTLRRLGIEPDSSVLRVLARARDFSTPLGIAMIVVQLTPLLFLAYLYFA